MHIVSTPIERRIALVALGACLVPALAFSAPTDEAHQVAQAIEKTLQRHGGDVHRCFAKALADRLDVAGKVEVEVEIGAAGKVSGARLISRGAPAELSSCVQKAAMAWTVDGIEAGAKVVLPFAFQAQSNQFVIKAGDVPERQLGGQAPGKAKPGPKREAPFSAKILADETNVRATPISLTQLTVGPASRVAMHRHPHSAKLLYLVRGHARLLGPAGAAPVKLDEGSAAFIPAGYPHVIENMGRQSTAVFLQAFVPPGPERVYRDPTDARGRAEFEVIRDPAAVKAPSDGEGHLVVVNAADVAGSPILGGKGTAKMLLAPAATGSPAFEVQLLELSNGAEMPRASRDSTEMLFIIEGAGKLTVGSEVMPFESDSLLFVPAGQPRSIKFTTPEKLEKDIVLQVVSPAPGQKPKATGRTP
jgi:mannose-6-phosphate isomerase-like protein (cupin superfamily)